MEKIEWEKEYNIGIELIDTQRQKLVEILNELNEVEKEKDIQKLKEIFYNLVCYSKINFSAEENVMFNINYPHYNFHKKEHEYFIGEIEKIGKEIEGENIYAALSALFFLKDWLINHIIKSDKEIMAYLGK